MATAEQINLPTSMKIKRKKTNFPFSISPLSVLSWAFKLQIIWPRESHTCILRSLHFRGFQIQSSRRLRSTIISGICLVWTRQLHYELIIALLHFSSSNIHQSCDTIKQDILPLLPNQIQSSLLFGTHELSLYLDPKIWELG